MGQLWLRRAPAQHRAFEADLIGAISRCPGGGWRRPRPACGRRASFLHIHVRYTHTTSLVLLTLGANCTQIVRSREGGRVEPEAGAHTCDTGALQANATPTGPPHTFLGRGARLTRGGRERCHQGRDARLRAAVQCAPPTCTAPSGRFMPTGPTDRGRSSAAAHETCRWLVRCQRWWSATPRSATSKPHVHAWRRDGRVRTHAHSDLTAAIGMRTLCT